jgi:hypothetical protein
VLQRLLLAGLLVATALMASGLLLSGGDRDGALPLFRLFSEGPAGERLMGLGVLVLALTPPLRVAALVLLWSLERDWRFVLVGTVVLMLLGAAIWTGGG